MRKLLLVITIITVAFCLICCDADSIAKTGENLKKLRNVNKSDVTGTVNLALNLSTGLVNAMIEDKESDFDPTKGNMSGDKLKALVGLINTVKETTAPDDMIVEALNKKAADVAQDKKMKIDIKKNVEDFLSNVENPEFIESMKAMLKDVAPGYDSRIDEVLNKDLPKVEKIARSILPAVDALQSINDQAYNHDGMTYGDVIGRAVLYNTTKDLVLLLTGTGTENLKTEIVNSTISNLTALEVIYGVSFDAPKIAGNLVENL